MASLSSAPGCASWGLPNLPVTQGTLPGTARPQAGLRAQCVHELAGCSPRLAISMAAAFPMPLFPPVTKKALPRTWTSKSSGTTSLDADSQPLLEAAEPEKEWLRSREHNPPRLTPGWAVCPLFPQPLPSHLPALLPGPVNDSLFSRSAFPNNTISFPSFRKCLATATIWHPN